MPELIREASQCRDYNAMLQETYRDFLTAREDFENSMSLETGFRLQFVIGQVSTAFEQYLRELNAGRQNEEREEGQVWPWTPPHVAKARVEVAKAYVQVANWLEGVETARNEQLDIMVARVKLEHELTPLFQGNPRVALNGWNFVADLCLSKLVEDWRRQRWCRVTVSAFLRDAFADVVAAMSFEQRTAWKHDRDAWLSSSGLSS